MPQTDRLLCKVPDDGWTKEMLGRMEQGLMMNYQFFFLRIELLCELMTVCFKYVDNHVVVNKADAKSSC